MKIASHIAAGLLGLIYLVFGLNFFLKFIPMPPMDPESNAAKFIFAIATTGFFAFIKIIEIIGAITIIIPKTRNLGLLLLGPIIVGILAYNLFQVGPAALFQPPVILSAVLAAFLLFTKKDSWLQLLKS
ncbi:MAG: DoxX family protein [Verrucomicrobiota bacterium]